MKDNSQELNLQVELKYQEQHLTLQLRRLYFWEDSWKLALALQDGFLQATLHNIPKIVHGYSACELAICYFSCMVTLVLQTIASAFCQPLCPACPALTTHPPAHRASAGMLCSSC